MNTAHRLVLAAALFTVAGSNAHAFEFVGTLRDVLFVTGEMTSDGDGTFDTSGIFDAGNVYLPEGLAVSGRWEIDFATNLPIEFTITHEQAGTVFFAPFGGTAIAVNPGTVTFSVSPVDTFPPDNASGIMADPEELFPGPFNGNELPRDSALNADFEALVMGKYPVFDEYSGLGGIGFGHGYGGDYVEIGTGGFPPGPVYQYQPNDIPGIIGVPNIGDEDATSGAQTVFSCTSGGCLPTTEWNFDRAESWFTRGLPGGLVDEGIILGFNDLTSLTDGQGDDIWTAVYIYTVTSVDGLDPDEDGVINIEDNCRDVANADQADANLDGIGNVCDADFNDDCSVNFLDLEDLKAGFFGNDPLLDLTDDGDVNFLDLAAMKDDFFRDYISDNPSGVPNDCDGT